MMIDTDEDRGKFVLLYEEYRYFMMTVAFGILKDNYLAEDALHEAFIKIAKNMDKIGSVRDLSTKRYLVSIVKSTAIDIYRKRKKQQEKEIVFEPCILENESVVNIENEENIVLEAIYNLPEQYREIFILRYSSGMEFSQIAEITNTTENTVRKRISRGKILLEKMIKDREVKKWG